MPSSYNSFVFRLNINYLFNLLKNLVLNTEIESYSFETGIEILNIYKIFYVIKRINSKKDSYKFFLNKIKIFSSLLKNNNLFDT